MTSPTSSTTTLTRSRLDLDRAVEAKAADTATEVEERDRWKNPFRALVLGLLGLAIAVGGFAVVASDTETDLDTLLRLLQLTCTDESTTGELARLCEQTEQVRSDNAAAVATASGLNTEQVIAIVQAELAAAPDIPGALPSTDDVIVLVRQVLAENPDLYRGEPGAGPTDEQVLMAVAAVIAANPEAFRGEDGAEGDVGPQGVGLSDLRFARRDGECVAVVVLEDPATSTTREVTRSVADAVCEDPTAPTPDPGPPVEPTLPDPVEPPPPTDDPPTDPPVTDVPPGTTEQPPPSTDPPLFG